MRCHLRLVVGFVLVVVAVMVAAPSAHADIYPLTSDRCTGWCGTPPFGTVTLTQNGTTVDITVQLSAGYSFVKTGAADFMNFKFNAVDIVVGDIAIDPHVPALTVATGSFNGDGTGEFDFGITCPSCPNGEAGAFTAPISFHVANATIADLTVPNNLGNVFVADVLAPNGNTGPAPLTSVPEPGTLALIGSGLVSFGVAIRRRWTRRG